MMDRFFRTVIIAGIPLVERIGRIKLQIIGFVGCACGLLVSGLSIRSDARTSMIFPYSGFVAFYFSSNFGPNAMTSLLAGEVFPTHVRGKGVGFAASFAKLGALIAAFVFPILLHTIGTTRLAGRHSPSGSRVRVELRHRNKGAESVGSRGDPT